MNQYQTKWVFEVGNRGFALALMLMAAVNAAWVQGQQLVLPFGDGLVGTYYRGPSFERFVMSRRDATIDFDWKFLPPGPGLPSEYFSVRWTGWLVAPSSGRFQFHARVDDGIRVWIDKELILDEWRPQVVRDFNATVTLRQGTAYRLKVEYFQDIRHTRALLNWSLPEESDAERRINADMPIPSRYLFRVYPKSASTAEMSTQFAPAAVPPPLADTSRNAQVAKLEKGESLALPELYFQQGQATLLPVTQMVLTRLASVLQSAPDHHFEVQGHTDNVGEPELNRQLSQRRAEAVFRYLTAKGVASNQLTPVGYGGTQPVADNADPNQRPRNRRVVLRRH